MSRVGVACCALLMLALGAGIDAHEIGKTQVVVSVAADGTYQIDIVVDPDALLTRLQIAASDDVRTPVTREDRDRQIAALMTTFAHAVHVRFDGVAASPTPEYRPASAFSDLAESPSSVRLRGSAPFDAHAMTFAYDLATGTFAMIARVRDSAAQTRWLEGGKESDAISIQAPPPPLSTAEVAYRYFALGFTHILPKGLDHILFVAGLFLLSTKWRSVLLQVSTFTVAHSITLALTIYGVVSLPARVVEPMIALSIAYVAIENMFISDVKSWRLALVFSFGLLHGMGFAGVLHDLGLPRTDFLTALVTFNLGVEAGQLATVALAFGVVAYWRNDGATYRRWVVQPASAAIAVLGLYWTVQRLL